MSSIVINYVMKKYRNNQSLFYVVKTIEPSLSMDDK